MTSVMSGGAYRQWVGTQTLSRPVDGRHDDAPMARTLLPETAERPAQVSALLQLQQMEDAAAFTVSSDQSATQS